MSQVAETLFTVTATVTRELERSFTSQELSESGGLAAAMSLVVLECAKYGTIVDEHVESGITSAVVIHECAPVESSEV